MTYKTAAGKMSRIDGGSLFNGMLDFHKYNFIKMKELIKKWKINKVTTLQNRARDKRRISISLQYT